MEKKEQRREINDSLEEQAKNVLREILGRMTEIESQVIGPAYKLAWDGLRSEFVSIVGDEGQEEVADERDSQEYLADEDIEEPTPPAGIPKRKPTPALPVLNVRGNPERRLPQGKTRSANNIDEEYESLLDDE